MSNIDKLKKHYPEIAKEYEKITQEQYNLFAGKMLDYGKGNISVGSNLDTEEETHVAMTKEANVKTESIRDTFQDLSIYGIIAQIVSNGKWK